MNSSEVSRTYVARCRELADDGSGGRYKWWDGLADHIEAQDKLIAELIEALEMAKVNQRIAEGMGVTAAQTHSRVESDQIRSYIRQPSPA